MKECRSRGGDEDPEMRITGTVSGYKLDINAGDASTTTAAVDVTAAAAVTTNPITYSKLSVLLLVFIIIGHYESSAGEGLLSTPFTFLSPALTADHN